MNLIFISIDTLRPDHMSVYGYQRPTTPNIAKRFAEALRFEKCYSSASSTCPGMACLFTGKFPTSHGVRTNGSVIMPEHETLAEVFRRSGYDSAAVVSNLFLRKWLGWDRGFAYYDHRLNRKELHRKVYERSAADTTAAAIGWLKGRAGKGKFLLWLHYIDPHGPYYPAASSFRGRFKAPPGKEVELSDHNYVVGRIPQYQHLTRPAPNRAEGSGSGQGVKVRDTNYYIAEYDAEILYTDACLEYLFRFMQEQHLWDNTVVVLTADHGESLGEHGLYFEHGLASYQETTHLPLFICLPGRQGRRVAEPFRAVDVAPTLLGMFGLSFRGGVDGRDLSSRLLRGKRLPSLLVHGEVGSDVPFNTKFIIRDEWKLIHSYGTERETALYYLEDDPGETKNVLEERPELARKLKRELDEWVRERDHRYRAPTPPMDKETEDAMRSLGYLH